MPLGNPDLYEKARKRKLGQLELPAVLGEQARWIEATYGVSIVWIDVVDREYTWRPTSRRLRLIVETGRDYHILGPRNRDERINAEVEHAVLARYRELCEAEGDASDYDPAHAFCSLDVFAVRAREVAVEAFAEAHRTKIRRAFPELKVWRAAQFGEYFVVFFYTDAQRERYANTPDTKRAGEWYLASSPEAERVVDWCWERVVPFDEFGYLTRERLQVKFDSKATVDARYGGSVVNYWR